MPKAMERKLKKQAQKKFGSTTGKRARKYIYGNKAMQRYLHGK